MMFWKMKISTNGFKTISKDYPSRIKITYNGKTGWIVIDQIRTIDKQRIVKILGSLSSKETKKVKDVIKETFVD